jgi:hypothetical protein
MSVGRYHARMTNHRHYAVLPILSLILLVSACAGTAATPVPTVAPTPAATSGDGSADAEPWFANAVEHRGMDGQPVDYECPAGGPVDQVWGTDVYTDDSSVCTAAVHAGVITQEEGGSVTIEIRPGEESYEGSERNGIETSEYPAWGGSFVIVDD